MNIAADGPIPLAATSAFLCCSSHFALLQSGVCGGGAAVANSAAPPHTAAFSQAEIAAAAFQLSLSLSPSSGVQKKRKNPYSTPVLLGLLHFALGNSSEHRIACRVFTRKQQEKPLFLTAAESLCYYYIVLHTTTT